LSSALGFAMATEGAGNPEGQWRFVSNLPETIENLAASGAIALALRSAREASYQHLNFKREALFGPYPTRP
jgi:hypothetical protein